MGRTYTTRQGDTWDMIAKEVYDDESQIGLLLQNNIQYVGVWIFGAGCVITVPDLPDEDDKEDDMPDWREEDDDEEEYAEEDDE